MSNTFNMNWYAVNFSFCNALFWNGLTENNLNGLGLELLLTMHLVFRNQFSANCHIGLNGIVEVLDGVSGLISGQYFNIKNGFSHIFWRNDCQKFLRDWKLQESRAWHIKCCKDIMKIQFYKKGYVSYSNWALCYEYLIRDIPQMYSKPEPQFSVFIVLI